jgi:hypothetical protein
VPAPPSRVQLNHPPLQMVEAQAHRTQGRGPNRDHSLHQLRKPDRQLQSLHAADRSTHHHLEPVDVEFLQQERLHPDDIADGDQGEIRPIGAPAEGIDRSGPSRPIARAQNINPDNAVAAGLEQPALGKQPRPPIGNPGRSRKRVSHEDDIIPRGVRLAIHRIVKRRRRKNPTRFKGESLTWRKVSLETGYDQRRAGAGAHRALSTSAGLAE